MRKTLLISEIFPPVHGGSGRWFWELYSRLPRDEYVIAVGQTEGSEEFDRTHDLNVIRIDLSSESWGIRSLVGLRFYWTAFRALRRITKMENIDTIHCGRCLPEGVFGYLFHKLYRIPYICYIHGEDIETASTSRELMFVVEKVLNRAKTLISNSKNTRQILLDDWHTNPDKTTVLHPGFDADRFVPAVYDKGIRSQLGWNDRPVILTVGRLQQRKGQDMLIRALPSIREKIPEILYAIIGDGEQRAVLQGLVDSLDLHRNVMFMSEVSDEQMIHCYQQCTLFALPNRTVGKDIEGFGMVLVEAQGCGKPVIAGNSGGTSETMKSEETGYIIDCTNLSTISETFIELLEKSPKELALMGAQGRAYVEQNFDWVTHTRKAEVIFKQVK